MKKAFDPITQTFLLSAISVFVLLLYPRTKNPLFAGLGISLFLLAAARFAVIIKNKGSKYSGNVTNESNEIAACILQETGDIISISPGMTVSADGVNTGIRPGKVYKLRNGTNVRIKPNGKVSAYSPVSSLINPGWKGRAYFKKQDALELWEPLFNCN